MGSVGSRRTLSGPEKVGLLLLALGKDRADQLLKRFDAEELNAIMRSSEAMGTVSTPQLEDVVLEFEGRFGQGLPFVGSGEEVKRLVTSAIAESRQVANAAGLIEERQDVWTRLPNLDDDILYGFLSAQHPQIIAYLLQRLGSDRSSTLLRNFAPARRNEIIARILGLRSVLPTIIEVLEESIERELFQADKGSTQNHLVLAGILNNFEKSDSSDTLAYLAELRPKDAEAIKKLLFKFEDLYKLSPKALTVLMDGVPVERVVIALQNMDEGFQQKVLVALSPRARRMAEAELRSGANATPRDLAESRRAIVDAVLKLVADGTVDLSATSAA